MDVLLGLILLFGLGLSVFLYRQTQRERWHFEQRVHRLHQAITASNKKTQQLQNQLALWEDFERDFSVRRKTLNQSLYTLYEETLELIYPAAHR